MRISELHGYFYREAAEQLVLKSVICGSAQEANEALQVCVMCMCVCVCIYVCMYVCMYVCTGGR